MGSKNISDAGPLRDAGPLQGPNLFRTLPKEVVRVILGQLGPRPDTWRSELLSLTAVDKWANKFFRPMMEMANLKSLLQRLEATDAQSDLYCARYQHAIDYLEDRTELLREEPDAFQDALLHFIRLLERLPEVFQWDHFCFLCSLTQLLEGDFSSPILIELIEFIPNLPWHDWEPGRKKLEAQKAKLSKDHQVWIDFAAQSMDLKFEGRAAALKWRTLLNAVAEIKSEQWRACTAHEVMKRFGACSWMPVLVKHVLQIADSLDSGKFGLLQLLAGVQHGEVCRLLEQGMREENHNVAATTEAMLAFCQDLDAGHKAPVLDAILRNLNFGHVAPLPLALCKELIKCCASLKEAAMASAAIAGKCIALVYRWSLAQALMGASPETAKDLRRLLLQYAKGQHRDMEALGAAFAVVLTLQSAARNKILPLLWKVVEHKVDAQESQRKLVSSLCSFMPRLQAPLGQQFLMQLLSEMNRLQLAFNDRELANLVSDVAGLPQGDERKSGLKMLMTAAFSSKPSREKLYGSMRTELAARPRQPQVQELWEDLWGAVLELAKGSQDDVLYPLLKLVAVSAIASTVPAINTARMTRLLEQSRQLPPGCQAQFVAHLAGTVHKAEYAPAAKAVSVHCAGLPLVHQPAVWGLLALSACTLHRNDFMAASKAVDLLFNRATHSGVSKAALLHGMAETLGGDDFSAVLLHKMIRLIGLLDKADRAAVLKKAIAAVTNLSALESRRLMQVRGAGTAKQIRTAFAAVREEAFTVLLKALKSLAKTGFDGATLSSLFIQMAKLVKQLRSELQHDSGVRLFTLAATVSIQCKASVAAHLPWKLS